MVLSIDPVVPDLLLLNFLVSLVSLLHDALLEAMQPEMSSKFGGIPQGSCEIPSGEHTKSY